jgi:hypothetical protein
MSIGEDLQPTSSLLGLVSMEAALRMPSREPTMALIDANLAAA